MKPMKKAQRDALTAGYCPLAPKGRKGKRGFVSKSAAKRAMKSSNRNYDKTPGKRRIEVVYLCRCGYWHVSSEARS